jgi:hypothetical protein
MNIIIGKKIFTENDIPKVVEEMAKIIPMYKIIFKNIVYQNKTLHLTFNSSRVIFKNYRFKKTKKFLGLTWFEFTWDEEAENKKSVIIVQNVESYTINPFYKDRGFGSFYDIVFKQNEIIFTSFDQELSHLPDDEQYMMKILASNIDMEIKQ